MAEKMQFGTSNLYQTISKFQEQRKERNVTLQRKKGQVERHYYKPNVHGKKLGV